MHVSDLGVIALVLALGFSGYTLLAAVLGAVRAFPPLVASARRGVLAVMVLLLLASAALAMSFLSHDFAVVYVANQSNRSMPWYFVAAAFYSGQEGSLLYWALLLSIFATLFVLTSRRAPAALVPYVIATLMGIELFFVLTLVTVSSPFVRFSHAPADGAGLNPLLRDPGMLIHPPTLLMGFMSFSLPFACAVAAMITGRLDGEWLRTIRRWMLAAWSIQTAGLLLGMWWSYHVLGWGGYWEWDPVENAALFPWLLATAFLHSSMVQERRGMLKVWNLGLVIAAFALSIFGTFEVRSGLISSVHSFAYSPIGGYFLAFLCVVVLFSLGLFLWRLPVLRPEQDFDSLLSREGSFLLNNFLLVGITAATLWGTLFPLVSQAFAHLSQTVGAPFYNQVDGPLCAVLLLAMGLGPLLAWRRTSSHVLWRNLLTPTLLAAACALLLLLCGLRDVAATMSFTICAFTGTAVLYELWRGMRVRHRHGEPYLLALILLIQRYRRRYGGYIVHLGLILLAAGIVGSHAFQQETDANLSSGQSLAIGNYRLVYFGNADVTYPDVETIAAQLQIWRNGQLQGFVYPARNFYPHFQNEPASAIAITTDGQLTDLYIFLADWQGPSRAALRVFLNPLVPLIWCGGLLMLAGGIICWWPARRRRGSRPAGGLTSEPGQASLVEAGAVAGSEARI